MGRPNSRFIKAITDADREYLLKTWRTHLSHAVRARAHAILLSAMGLCVNQLTEIFQIDDDTARSWLNRWEEFGRDGLEDAPRPGGPPKLNEAERQLAIDLLHEHPSQPRVVIDEIVKRTGKTISRRTLCRIAVRAHMRWKRFRKSLKHLRNPEQFALAQSELAEISRMPDVKLAYFDEATFSLTAVVPYGWQEIGKTETINLSGSRRSVSVLGVQEEHHTVTFLHGGTINGKTVASVIDNYASHIRKTTVLVLDNASPHTCNLVLERKSQWEEKGLILYPLPAYSPELNEIEHVWKDVKYSKLPAAAWSGLKSLVQSLTSTFKSLGRVVLMPSLVCE